MIELLPCGRGVGARQLHQVLFFAFNLLFDYERT